MTTTLAVLADPHFHDTGLAGLDRDGDGLFVRTLADTAESTRVFNESGAALVAALDDIVSRGIRLVVIAGDLTDDGQAASWATLDAMLARYAREHGLRFFATPGNHDQFANTGRHQAKRMLNADGSFDLVTSSAGIADADARRQVVTPAMYCLGYDRALRRQTPLGYFRDPRDLHWETPFGRSDALADRQSRIVAEDGRTAGVIDASYLVEPEEGLWLLALDANVYVPDGPDDGFTDRSQDGWNAVLSFKPYLMDWAADVARRARAGGKTLLTFSHYPVTDISAGTYAREAALRRAMPADRRRMPGRAVSEAFVNAGIPVHFSGHWHINNTGRFAAAAGGVVNIALPSLVAMPAAYKIATVSGDRLGIETVVIDEAPGFDIAFDRYRAEGGEHRALAEAGTLDAFLEAHLKGLVHYRYLPRDWPPEFRIMVRELRMHHLCALAGEGAALAHEDLGTWLAARTGRQGADGPAFSRVFEDLYRFRNAGGIAAAMIGSRDLSCYQALAAAFDAGDWPAGSVQADVSVVFRMLLGYVEADPSVDFAVDLARGAVLEGEVSAAAPSGARRA